MIYNGKNDSMKINLFYFLIFFTQLSNYSLQLAANCLSRDQNLLKTKLKLIFLKFEKNIILVVKCKKRKHLSHRSIVTLNRKYIQKY